MSDDTMRSMDEMPPPSEWPAEAVVVLVYPDGSEREAWLSGWDGWTCIHPTDGPMLVEADDVEPIGWRER